MPTSTESATILVVDDDGAIRTLVRHSLERSGYATLAAGSGEEALQVFGEHRSDIALLLTDVTMPGIDGLELARRIHGVKPELPVLVMSALFGRPSEAGPYPFLPKPFIAPDLLRHVRHVLGQT